MQKPCGVGRLSPHLHVFPILMTRMVRSNWSGGPGGYSLVSWVFTLAADAILVRESCERKIGENVMRWFA